MEEELLRLNGMSLERERINKIILPSLWNPPTDILSYVDLVISSSCILVIITSMFNINYGLSISILCIVGSILFAMLNKSKFNNRGEIGKMVYQSNVIKRIYLYASSLYMATIMLMGSKWDQNETVASFLKMVTEKAQAPV